MYFCSQTKLCGIKCAHYTGRLISNRLFKGAAGRGSTFTFRPAIGQGCSIVGNSPLGH